MDEKTKVVENVEENVVETEVAIAEKNPTFFEKYGTKILAGASMVACAVGGALFGNFVLGKGSSMHVDNLNVDHMDLTVDDLYIDGDIIEDPGEDIEDDDD